MPRVRNTEGLGVVTDHDQPASLRIGWATSDADILGCLPCLRELIPRLPDDGNDFVARVNRMQQSGYRLMAVWSGDIIVACALYRVIEDLIRGRYLHIDELVTTRGLRSNGIGSRLLDALIKEARHRQCRAVRLECAVRNRRAHHFYFREGLRVTGLRFAAVLERDPGGK